MTTPHQDDLSDRDQILCNKTVLGGLTNVTNHALNDDNAEEVTIIETDSLTISQFLRHRPVAALLILIASLSQGAFSQVQIEHTNRVATKVSSKILGRAADTGSRPSVIDN